MGGYNAGIERRQSVNKKVGMEESQWEMKVKIKLAKQIKKFK